MESTNQKTDESDNIADFFDGGVAEAILSNPSIVHMIEQIAAKRRNNARIRSMFRDTTEDQWRQEQGKVWELNFWAGISANARKHIEKKNRD